MDILSDVSVSGKLTAKTICATGPTMSGFNSVNTNYLYIDGSLTIKRDPYESNWFNFEPRIRTTEIAVNRISLYGYYSDAIYLGNSQEEIIVCGVLKEPGGDKFAIKRRVQISVPESCLKFYVGNMYDGWHPIVTAWDTTSRKRIELDYGYDENNSQFYAQRTNSEALCLTFYYV